MLHYTHKTIAKEFQLTRKSGFREKLGRKQDLMYVCYPPHVTGGRNIAGFLKEGHKGDQ